MIGPVDVGDETTRLNVHHSLKGPIRECVAS